MLETIAFLSGKKWTSLMIGRVYFGNWLRQVPLHELVPYTTC